MRARINSYIGFAFVGSFSCLMGMLVLSALASMPEGIPPGTF